MILTVTSSDSGTRDIDTDKMASAWSEAVGTRLTRGGWDRVILENGDERITYELRELVLHVSYFSAQARPVGDAESPEQIAAAEAFLHGNPDREVVVEEGGCTVARWSLT